MAEIIKIVKSGIENLNSYQEKPWLHAENTVAGKELRDFSLCPKTATELEGLIDGLRVWGDATVGAQLGLDKLKSPAMIDHAEMAGARQNDDTAKC